MHRTTTHSHKQYRFNKIRIQGTPLSTATTKLANSPTTDAADDIVVTSLSILFN